MTAYVVRRLLLIIPTLFILTILVFLLVRFLPGNVIDLIEVWPQPTGLGQTGNRFSTEYVQKPR